VVKVARKQRIHYKGALYHVMARGNNRECHLLDEKNKQEYINIIKRYKERYGFKLYAYCIMDNHVHLLIEVDEVPLNKIMQGIQQVYTQRYNKNNMRTGHVFQQRYKAIVCNKESYLLQLIKYIHFNPIEAGITNTTNYKWSSYSEYVNGISEFVDIDFLLNILSTNRKKAIKCYKEYMMAPMEEIEESEYEEIESQSSTPIHIENEKEVDELINSILKITKVTKEELVSRTRRRQIADTRKVIVNLADKTISNRELADKLELTTSAVSKMRVGRNNLNEKQREIVNQHFNA